MMMSWNERGQIFRRSKSFKNFQKFSVNDGLSKPKKKDNDENNDVGMNVMCCGEVFRGNPKFSKFSKFSKKFPKIRR